MAEFCTGDDPLIARAGPTIESLGQFLRDLRLPDAPRPVCWNQHNALEWRWGDDPSPGWRCEDGLDFVSGLGGQSDAWDAIRGAAWAVDVWVALNDPRPGSSQRDLMAWSFELGMIVRELEVLGLVDKDGRTLSELAEKARAAINNEYNARKKRAEKARKKLKPIDDLMKRALSDDRELSGPDAAREAINAYNKRRKRNKLSADKYQYGLWRGFKDRHPDWLMKHRRDLVNEH